MTSLQTINSRLQYLERYNDTSNIQNNKPTTNSKVQDNKKTPSKKEQSNIRKETFDKKDTFQKKKERFDKRKEMFDKNLNCKLNELKKVYNRTEQVNLTDCIGSAFYEMHQDIKENKHTYYNLEGGRGSLKSSTVSIEIVLGMTKDREANGVVYRKVADTLAQSVYEQILWAIDILGMNDDWKCTKSPMMCEYKPFGTRIIFKGLDKAKKSKSLKFAHGYAKYLWFEEFDEFNGSEEIRSVQQSVLRGGDKFFVFRSMNPPKSKSNWANEYMQTESLREDTYTSHTTYLQAPAEWLGQQFIEDAEWLKETKPEAYKHEYLGEMIGTGADVFDNVVSKRFSDEDILYFANIYMGVDWGWFPDPYRWVKMNYDANRRVLSIFDEYSCNKRTNEQTFAYLRDVKGVKPTDILTCDSAEHKSTGDYRVWGFNARDAVKGPGSVEHGIHWLQQLVSIEIDPVRCPKTYDEFYHYELELDSEGNPINDAFPDYDNHSIDAVRYGMERVSTRRGR